MPTTVIKKLMNQNLSPLDHTTLEALSAMEKLKWKYLDYILKLNHEKKLSHYIEAIKGIEEEARAWYADEINLERNLFRKMLLIDGCFVLHLLHGLEGLTPIPGLSDHGNSESTESHSEDDQQISFAMEQFYNDVLSRDLPLVENQIPFNVVTKIHEVVTNGSIPSEVLVNYFIESMNDIMGCYPKALGGLLRPNEFHHLLHLCHMYFEPTKKYIENSEKVLRFESLDQHQFGDTTSSTENNSGNLGFQGSLGRRDCPWHRASEYLQAGIEFKKKDFSRDNPHSLLDLEFRNGIIEIPSLTIDPNTCSLFMNLIAFENCCPQFGNYVTAYVVFLSCFISMPDDVTLLITKGTIEHELNSDADVPTLFRELSEGIIFDFNSDYYLKSLCHMMEAHYQSQRPRFREWLGTIASKISRTAGNKEAELTEVIPPEHYV